MNFFDVDKVSDSHTFETEISCIWYNVIGDIKTLF